MVKQIIPSVSIGARAYFKGGGTKNLEFFPSPSTSFASSKSIQSTLKHSIHGPRKMVTFISQVSTGPQIHIHKKHGKTIKWLLNIFSCFFFLCSASPRFLFRLTIECTREYKKNRCNLVQVRLR